MHTSGTDRSDELQQRIQEAAAQGRRLYLRGGGSKAFHVGPEEAEILGLGEHRGIVAYEPTELVVTARAGTPLAELEAVLAEHNQILPFEPPHFEGGATIGGAVASGFSGPRRFALGTVRDAVLGVECINGRGQRLRFGGVVMKNVAGYDLARLLVGSFGNLACLLEISVKVLPAPEQEQTRLLEIDYAAGLELIQRLTAEAVPVSASAYLDGCLHLRLSGPARVVAAAGERIGGELAADGAAFWRGLRDQTLPFFRDPRPLWRLSLPPQTILPELPGAALSECGGQLVWLHDDSGLQHLTPQLAAVGGHARLFRTGNGAALSAAAPPTLAALLQRVKQSFDPNGIFMPTRRYGAI